MGVRWLEADTTVLSEDKQCAALQTQDELTEGGGGKVGIGNCGFSQATILGVEVRVAEENRTMKARDGVRVGETEYKSGSGVEGKQKSGESKSKRGAMIELMKRET